MGIQPETITYDGTVYSWELTDPVQGAIGGIANTPLLNLSNRTAWLKSQVDALNVAIALKAPLNSPPFTGSPTVPDVAAGDASTKIADTNFVQTARAGIATVNTTGGNTTLAQAVWGCGVIVVSGTLTSNATLTFPAAIGNWVVENLTTGAFTLIAKTAATTGVTIPQAGALEIVWDGTNLVRTSTVLTRNKEVQTSDLSDTGVAAGAYTKANITVGVDGRVSAAANGSISGAEVVAALGYTPVQQGTGAGQLPASAVKIGWTGSKLKAQVDSTDLGNILLLSDFTGTNQGSGYQKLPGGLILQWFGAGVPVQTVTTFNFPIAFPNAVLSVVGAIGAGMAPLNTVPAVLGVSPINLSQYQAEIGTPTITPDFGCLFFAVGF
jgi:hypothetical protein